MGCDIHAYIDMDAEWSRQGERPFADHFGHVRIERNYELFGLLAGVRGVGPAVVEPRGIPPTKREADEKGLPLNTPLVSMWTEGEYGLYVRAPRPEPKKGEEPEPEPYEEGTCSYEDAVKWTESGWSRTISAGAGWRISNPDWHTASYLFLEEVMEVQDRYRQRGRSEGLHGYSQPLNAIVAAMKALGARSRARLVFWFDN